MILRIAHITVAVVLTCSIALLGISPEAFHHHEEEAHCHEDHQSEAVDSCHLAIAHNKVHLCEDHDHLSESHVPCKLCNLVAGHYWLFQPMALSADQPAFESTLLIEHAQPWVKVNNQSIRFTRGPPSRA